MSDETITLPCGAVMRPWSDAVFDDWRVCDATAALGMLRRTVPCIAWFGDDMRSGAESTCLAWLDERIREARAALRERGR